MQPFAHRQFKTALFPIVGLKAQTLTSGSTINTYNTGQRTTAIDSWNGGKIFPKRVMVLLDVGSFSTTGSLTVSLRDASVDLTNATGDASSTLVAQLAAVTTAGLYFAEINLAHVFPDTTDAQSYIRRYHSVRAVAADANIVFSCVLIYSFFDGTLPTQEATELAVSYNDPS